MRVGDRVALIASVPSLRLREGIVGTVLYTTIGNLAGVDWPQYGEHRVHCNLLRVISGPSTLNEVQMDYPPATDLRNNVPDLRSNASDISHKP